MMYQVGVYPEVFHEEAGMKKKGGCWRRPPLSVDQGTEGVSRIFPSAVSTPTVTLFNGEE